MGAQHPKKWVGTHFLQKTKFLLCSHCGKDYNSEILRVKKEKKLIDPRLFLFFATTASFCCRSGTQKWVSKNGCQWVPKKWVPVLERI